MNTSLVMQTYVGAIDIDAGDFDATLISGSYSTINCEDTDAELPECSVTSIESCDSDNVVAFKCLGINVLYI